MSGRIVEGWTAQFALMLLVATVVAAVARRFRVPYEVALVLTGLAIAAPHVFSLPSLDPGLLLFAFLPPLLLDASFRIDVRELRAVARPVALLAVPGVLLTAVLVGSAVAWLLGLPLATGLLFGSIVAATDPVAVVALMRQLHLPPRMSVVSEAESLINDGMAITLYIVFLELSLGHAIGLGGALGLLATEVVGGLAVGAALGFAFSRATALIDDPLIEMTLSTALAFGSYLLADSLHMSGALACVAAGLVHGSYGREVGMSNRTSERLDLLWEYLGFAANAIIFLLVGFTADLGAFVRNLWPVVVAVLAVLVARVVVVELVGVLTARSAASISPRERLVLVWAGLRGALTLALALGLPLAVPHRALLIDMAFGVVLVTLVGLGLTLPVLVRRLDLPRETGARAPMI